MRLYHKPVIGPTMDSSLRWGFLHCGFKVADPRHKGCFCSQLLGLLDMELQLRHFKG